VNLAGVLAPVPTPFSDDGDVDLERLQRAYARWVNTPLDGFVVLGTNGEAALISDDESDQVVAAARAAVPSDRTFIIGTGRESTRATVGASRRAADLGADAVIVRTPSFFKTQMTSDALISHYRAVADASPVPVLLYNFTAITGVTLEPDTVSVLSAHPNIVGMKESGGDTARISRLVAAVPPSFYLLAGSAASFHAALQAGASGGVLALAALLPEACSRLLRLTRSGRHDEASALQAQVLPLARLVGSVYGIAGLKAALNLAGYDVGAPRPPLAAASPDAIAALKEALASLEDVAA
jgi:4-hydroxy-2-oxoglutarate aldolase